MLHNFRQKLVELIAPAYIAELSKRAKDIDAKVNQRVAEQLLRMDPFEPLMRQAHCVFSEDFQKVEEPLNTPGQISMWMWGWQQKRDPNFERMVDWIINTQGNAMLKAPARTDEDRAQILMWGKAQIANMVLLKREVGRLASLYEELLVKHKDDDFDSSKGVE